MSNTDTLVGMLDGIGDAIRAKTGGSAKLTLDEMPDEIAGISGGGPFEQYTEMLTTQVLKKFNPKDTALYESDVKPFLVEKCRFVETTLNGAEALYDPKLCRVYNNKLYTVDDPRESWFTMSGQSNSEDPEPVKYLGGVCLNYLTYNGICLIDAATIPAAGSTWRNPALYNGTVTIARNLTGAYHATESGLYVMTDPDADPLPASI